MKTATVSAVRVQPMTTQRRTRLQRPPSGSRKTKRCWSNQYDSICRARRPRQRARSLAAHGVLERARDCQTSGDARKSTLLPPTLIMAGIAAYGGRGVFFRYFLQRSPLWFPPGGRGGSTQTVHRELGKKSGSLPSTDRVGRFLVVSSGGHDQTSRPFNVPHITRRQASSWSTSTPHQDPSAASILLG